MLEAAAVFRLADSMFICGGWLRISRYLMDVSKVDELRDLFLGLLMSKLLGSLPVSSCGS